MTLYNFFLITGKVFLLLFYLLPNWFVGSWPNYDNAILENDRSISKILDLASHISKVELAYLEKKKVLFILKYSY